MAREPVTIEAATIADLDALLDLEKISFSSDRLSRRQFAYHLRRKRNRLLVARTKSQPVAGYLLLIIPSAKRPARIYSLAVHPDCRGRGVGEMLCRHVEKNIRQSGGGRIRLEVRASNRAARCLYEKLGYAVIFTLPAYYEDGSDAVRMEKAVT